MELESQRARAPLSVCDVPTSRVADTIVEVLIGEGVDVLFGLPGGPISPIHDALLDRPGVRVITTRHESGAMFAAAGYAQTSGRLGVALVTSGPGILNAITGLASAHCDGLPLLVLVGEVPRRLFGRGALQDGSSYSLNILSIARNVCKFAAEIHEPHMAPALVRRAIATALSGRRGPVVLTLPMDIATTQIIAPELALEVSTTCAIPSPVIDRVAQTLSESRRPVLFVGSGVRRGEGPAKLLEFAERAQLPVMTTPKGKGIFPEDHPLSLGIFGMAGHPSTYEYLSGGVDTLIAVGTSLGDLATDGWSPLLRPSRGLIHVDVEASQLGRSYPVTLGIAASAELFFSKLVERIPQVAVHDFGGPRLHGDPESISIGDNGLISPQRALWEIQRVLPRDTIFTCDSGEHFLFATHYLKTVVPDGYIAMTGLGSMGSSIGAAMGARLARPDRVVAAIVGDGCFAMNAFEVATAASAQLPLFVFVFNDARLGMVELGHDVVYGRRPSYSTDPMNVPELAAALGAHTLVVERPGEILGADLLAMGRGGPVVVDVRIDPSVRMPKRDRFEAFGNGGKPAASKVLN